MTPDDRLTAFLAETPDPSVADVFVAEVMEAVERRALVDRLLVGGAGALALSAVLWACSPVLNLAVNALALTLLPVAGILAFTLAAAAIGTRLLPRN